MVDKYENLSNSDLYTLLRKRTDALHHAHLLEDELAQLPIVNDMMAMLDSLKFRLVTSRIHPPETADEMKWADDQMAKLPQ